MATSIERVRRAVAQTPWAILPEKLDQICEFLALRAEGRLSAEEIQAAAGSKRTGGRMQSGGVAVLPVYGTISQRMDLLSEASGGTSTESLGRSFDAMMADPDIGTIILDVDSPGGTVPGVAALSRKIFEARGQGKRIIAVSNPTMASAAYWIASAADEIVAAPASMTGNIGAFIPHKDFSAAEEKAGVKVTLISAGKHKTLGNPHEPLSDEARSTIQAMVDDIYADFVGDVARNRGVSASAVRNGFGEGLALLPKQAVAAGLADRVATLDDVLAELGVGQMRARGGVRAEAPSLVPAASDSASAGVVVHQAVQEMAGVSGAAPEEAEHAPTTQLAPAAEEQAMSQIDNAANGAATSVTAGTADGASPVVVGVDFRAERERARAITELCEMHGIKGEAADFIENGASVNEVVAQIRDRAQANLDAMKASHVEMSEKERKSYSISRAILAAADREQNAKPSVDDGFEREVSEHIRTRLPKDYKSRGGFFAPMAVLNTGTSTAGGNTIFTREGDFIDLLRAQMKVAQLGATILTGLEGGTIAFPKQTGASSWTWVAENPGSDVATSDATFGQVLLAPKAGQSATSYTRQLLAQSSLSVEQFVRSDMQVAAALGIDLAAINGSGASNQPTGILNTSGIGSVAGGTNGAAPTYAHMVDLETEIAVDNADIGSMAYLSTPGIRGKLKKTEVFSGTNGQPVWTGGKEGELNGYPAHVSTQVPSTLTKGTSSGVCHAIIFGVWSQLLIGYWGALEVVVDPYTLKRQGLIEVANFQMVGLAVRHAEAFAAMKDALVS